MKRILFPTLFVLCLLVGFLIGNAVSNKANAQRITIRDGQILITRGDDTYDTQGKMVK